MMYYNSSKAEVDTHDQIIRCYLTKKATCHQPMAVFYNIINITAFNAFFLYIKNNPQFYQYYKKQSRKIFKMLPEEFLKNNNTTIQSFPMKRKQPINTKCLCFICKVEKKYNSLF